MSPGFHLLHSSNTYMNRSTAITKYRWDIFYYYADWYQRLHSQQFLPFSFTFFSFYSSRSLCKVSHDIFKYNNWIIMCHVFFSIFPSERNAEIKWKQASIWKRTILDLNFLWNDFRILKQTCAIENIYVQIYYCLVYTYIYVA